MTLIKNEIHTMLSMKMLILTNKIEKHEKYVRFIISNTLFYFFCRKFTIVMSLLSFFKSLENHLYEYVLSTGYIENIFFFDKKNIFIFLSVNGTNGTNRILRDFSKKIRDGTFGIGTFRKFTGQDKRDSGLFKNFRDGTFGIRDMKKFVPQTSKENS